MQFSSFLFVQNCDENSGNKLLNVCRAQGLCDLWHKYCLTPYVNENHKRPQWSLLLPISLFVTSETPVGWTLRYAEYRSFDLCLTVNIHTFQNAVCTALHECFLPAQWRCHTGTCLKLQPHSPALEPLEETGGNPWLTKKNNSSPTLWSALLWVTPVCDDNERRKEGNDFVSD